ncbi:hypothetical protein, partial [Roseiarcus sp.]|uniref:hypothetical protein n=1 Tax=Roseiarcus sp. TaxID=1969460 RepID=UPI003F9C144F
RRMERRISLQTASSILKCDCPEFYPAVPCVMLKRPLENAFLAPKRIPAPKRRLILTVGLSP